MVEISADKAKAFKKFEEDQAAKVKRGKGRRLAMKALKSAHAVEWEELKVKYGVKKAS